MTPLVADTPWVLSDDLREDGWRAVGESLDWSHEDGSCSVSVEPVYLSDEDARRRRSIAWNAVLTRRDDAGDVTSCDVHGSFPFGVAMRAARAMREDLVAETDRTPTVRLPVREGAAP